ncbi:hypothetical protein Zm00014a_005236, partial [Zea mays]
LTKKVQKVRFEPTPLYIGRRVEDTGRNCLTSRTSYSTIYNIEYKLYIIKKIVSGRTSTMDRGYGPSNVWRSCWVGLVTIKWVVPRAGSPDMTHLVIYTSAR